MEREKGGLILGLDIGSNSIGWTITDESKGEIVDTGVRVFEAAVEGDIESGSDESHAKARRDARQIRRQLWRRAHRKRKLLLILQQHGLLPQGNIGEITASIDKRHIPPEGRDDARVAHRVPYILRARALDEKLEPDELGRILYHLCQRRGFKSNRKAGMDEKESKTVGKGISELGGKMEEAGARTLGEYFSTLDPEEERIRGRYTSRKMYEDEFDAIWEAQRRHYPHILTDNLKRRIYNALFYQRPLKSQAHLIGKCELETDEPRAPWALLIAQRFRLLQRLNDARIQGPDGKPRPLTDEQRRKLLPALEGKETVSYTHLTLPTN